MKIASYNIMSGGFNDYEYETATPQRLPQLQSALKAIDADVIGLVDTFRWDDIYTPDDLQRIFGYGYAVTINLNDERLREKGHNNALTLLSNVEIKNAAAVSLGSRDALRATLFCKHTEIGVFLTYLDDISEDTRLAQIRALGSLVDARKPLIVMGDLNTLSVKELPAVKMSLVDFYAANAELEEGFAPVVAEMQRGEVVQALDRYGLHDASINGGSTFPSKLFPAKSSAPFLRLDYCFHSPSVRVSGLTAANGDIYDAASDHLPIVFEAEPE